MSITPRHLVTALVLVLAGCAETDHPPGADETDEAGVGGSDEGSDEADEAGVDGSDETNETDGSDETDTESGEANGSDEDDTETESDEVDESDETDEADDADESDEIDTESDEANGSDETDESDDTDDDESDDTDDDESDDTDDDETDEPIAPEPTLTVVPVPDEASAASAFIGYDGGSLTATGADGTVYTLEIPADSLRYPTTITMTPLTTVEGTPWGDGSIYAVQLEPSGTILDVYGRLTIEPPLTLPPDEQILFGYRGEGTDLALALPDLDSSDIVLLIEHFSGAGVKKGYLGDVEEVRQRLGGTAAQQIVNEINAAFQAEKARMQADDSSSSAPMSEELRQQLEHLLERFEKEVVDVRIKAAGTSCAAARLAAETILEYKRQLGLLGLDGDTSGLMAQVLEQLRPCVEEEYELCAEQHVIHRIRAVWTEIERQSQLNGGAGSSVVELARQRVEDCLRFELELTSDGRVHGEGAEMMSSVTATVPFEFSAAGRNFRYEARPLRNTAYSYAYDDGDCSYSNTPGDGVFEPVSLGWNFEWGKMPDGKPGGLDSTLGEVTDLTLVWTLEHTLESTIMHCPESPSTTLIEPGFGVWSSFIWAVLHYEELWSGGGYRIEFKENDLLRAGIWAQKEFMSSAFQDGITTDEQTLFTLRHIPRKSN